MTLDPDNSMLVLLKMNLLYEICVTDMPDALDINTEYAVSLRTVPLISTFRYQLLGALSVTPCRNITIMRSGEVETEVEAGALLLG
jgi:hypothetical protein